MDYDYLNVSDGNGNAALMHVETERTAGSTTLDVDIVTGVPDKFIGTYGAPLPSGFIDPATARDFYGHLDGSNLEIDSFAPGSTDNGTPEGYVVIIKPNTPWANLVATGIQGTALFPANFSDFVETTGAVWTIASGLNGNLSAGHVWKDGHRNVVNAVSNHLFAASKDTYVDIDPTTGDATYVEVANGAAEPAITTDNVRIAKVVTGASTIGSIWQREYSAQVAATNVRTSSFGQASIIAKKSANQTTTSTSFQVITDTYYSGGTAQLVTTGGRLQLNVSVPCYISGGNVYIGIRIGSTDYEITNWNVGAAGGCLSGHTIVNNLPAGTYTCSIVFRSQGGGQTATIPAYQAATATIIEG